MKAKDIIPALEKKLKDVDPEAEVVQFFDMGDAYEDEYISVERVKSMTLEGGKKFLVWFE